MGKGRDRNREGIGKVWDKDEDEEVIASAKDKAREVSGIGYKQG